MRISDWSSDVCSSDLRQTHGRFPAYERDRRMSGQQRRALVASPADYAREAENLLRQQYEFVPLEEADMVIALGGDGFMLQTLHHMLESRRKIGRASCRERGCQYV